ncbi:MAG TPA: hypothetical protein VM782_11815, partial [Stellaceae bacterium]|nr:hypothetical protein [Stellaceae bacterium]
LLSYRLIESRYLLAQVPPGDKQWAHDQGDFGGTLKQRFDALIKFEAPAGAGQQAERLQHTAYHIGEARRHAYELSASSKESSRAVRIERLHMDGTIPSRPHDLRQAFSVVLVSLVQPHMQCGLHSPGI